jgi:hypothetical protein
MALEQELIEPLIVKGAEFRRQTTEGPDKPELRGDDVNGETEQSPRPMRLPAENGESFYRWESLIFQKVCKLFRRAPINPEKQPLRQRKIRHDCESLRLSN